MKSVLYVLMASLVTTFSLFGRTALADDHSSEKNPNVFISFSGGGYHAHAGAFVTLSQTLRPPVI